MSPSIDRKGSRGLLGVGLSLLVIGAARGETGLPATPEPVPELLALAPWPLDADGEARGAAAAAPVEAAVEEASLALEAREEIQEREVKTVFADGCEDRCKEPDEPLQLPAGEGFTRLAALGADELEGLRGGFEPADGGLRFSFGIERVVYINGQLVASTVLQIDDLQAVAGGAALPVALPGNAADAMNIVQNGAGNVFAAGIGAEAVGTVIQNTLDGQGIATVTTVNAAVNSLEVMRTLTLQSAIRDGVIDSLRR